MDLQRRKRALAGRSRRRIAGRDYSHRFTGREQIRLKEKTGGGRGRSSCRRFFCGQDCWVTTVESRWVRIRTPIGVDWDGVWRKAEPVGVPQQVTKLFQ